MGGEASRVTDDLLRAAEVVHADEVSVAFANGPKVRAKVGDALLDIAEASQVPMESGCRMGMCGSDPVRIIEGAENLSRMRNAERRTLDRLGLTDDCRMACVARVQGPVVVAPQPGPEAELSLEERLPTRAGRGAREAIRSVVIIGAGVAGVTVAEQLRRALPETAIALLGEEPYDFYNRMAITRLVSESVSIDSLYLNRRGWAESRRIEYRRGEAAAAIDRSNQFVETDRGERLEYDRLVIATGAHPFVPPIEGFGTKGTFVMRTIDDAVQMQQHIRATRCHRALVVGGGLLGLEAAYNIARLGVRVFVLDRGPWPLSRQLDEQAGGVLWEMVHDLGIEMMPSSEARRVLGDGDVAGIELLDGSTIEAELCLVSTGVRPNAELAHDAGLEITVGIAVDDTMQTSDTNVFAVGDVCDHRGHCYGLWPASVEQAQVAADRIVGRDVSFQLTTPPARLKVPGIDLLSIGDIHPLDDGVQTIVISDRGARRYRKLVLDEGRLTAAIVIGSPELFDDVTRAVEARLDLSAELERLEQGDWTFLSHAMEPATLER